MERLSSITAELHGAKFDGQWQHRSLIQSYVGAPQEDVAINADGIPVIPYRGVLWYAWDDSNTQSSPAYCEVTDSGSPISPQVEPLVGSTFAVVWRENQTGSEYLSFNTCSNPREDASARKTIISNAPAIGSFRLLSANGHLRLAWVEAPLSDGAPNRLLFKTFEGNTWQPEALLAEANGPLSLYSIQLAEDSAGNVTVAWIQDGALWTRRLVQGVWLSAMQLANDAREPRLAADATGTVTLVVQEHDAGQTVVRAYQLKNEVWDAGQLLSIPNGGDAGLPALAVESNGTTTVAWQQGSLFVRRLVNGAWQEPIALAAPEQPANDPAIVADQSGKVTVVWNDRTCNFASRYE